MLEAIGSFLGGIFIIFLISLPIFWVVYKYDEKEKLSKMPQKSEDDILREQLKERNAEAKKFFLVIAKKWASEILKYSDILTKKSRTMVKRGEYGEILKEDFESELQYFSEKKLLPIYLAELKKKKPKIDQKFAIATTAKAAQMMPSDNDVDKKDLTSLMNSLDRLKKYEENLNFAQAWRFEVKTHGLTVDKKNVKLTIGSEKYDSILAAMIALCYDVLAIMEKEKIK